jgi:5-methylcytosine-specific restriction endonuclease McrA
MEKINVDSINTLMTFQFLFNNSNYTIIMMYLLDRYKYELETNSDSIWIPVLIEDIRANTQISIKTITAFINIACNCDIIERERRYTGLVYKNFYNIDVKLIQEVINEYVNAIDIIKSVSQNIDENEVYDISETLTLVKEKIKKYKNKNSTIRSNAIEYNNMILERDKYKCQKCGSNKKLRVHHKYPVSTHWMFENDLWNGITLCKECHEIEHKKEELNIYRLSNIAKEIRKSLAEKGTILGEIPDWAVEKYMKTNNLEKDK